MIARRFVLATAVALVAFPALAGCRKPPAPQDEATPQPAVADARLAAAVITIAHGGVEHYASARPKPTRTKPEALALATELAATAKKSPAQFRDLAAQRSEDPFAAEGGELRAWTKGENAELDAVVAPLAVGAISDPVDTEYGYRIFVRLQPLPVERIAARHLVVAWSGATRAPRSITRSKTEALERARELSARARRDPNALEALVQAESDGWDKAQGGGMGQWNMDGGRYPVSFDRAIAALSLSQGAAISEPIESEFGYQIFQRLPLTAEADTLAGAHIVISFRGAKKAAATVERSRAEAEEKAQGIAREARANPERFGQLAVANSDDPSGRAGGDLGVWKKGAMPVVIDDKLASLKAGEISDPVLTPFGYHVLLRREAPTDKAYVVK
ncbi:peptidylprolyl isomerase [Pendulispora rubella]|uniref:peptidylprolyl isomerase n=1 Tax=Pendulispora rubella TaxID=2741070 RepID=A0ABZ2LEJ9_9BACT